jgi:hypothetical protein
MVRSTVPLTPRAALVAAVLAILSAMPLANALAPLFDIYRKIDGGWFMVRHSFNSQQPRNGL